MPLGAAIAFELVGLAGEEFCLVRDDARAMSSVSSGLIGEDAGVAGERGVNRGGVYGSCPEAGRG